MSNRPEFPDLGSLGPFLSAALTAASEQAPTVLENRLRDDPAGSVEVPVSELASAYLTIVPMLAMAVRTLENELTTANSRIAALEARA